MDKLNYFTSADAQLMLGVTDRTLRRWTRSGKVRNHKDGGRVFYNAEDIINLRNKKIGRAHV